MQGHKLRELVPLFVLINLSIFGSLNCSKSASVSDGSASLNSNISFDWKVMNSLDAPVGRRTPSMVWSGSQMIVWGGYRNNLAVGDGGMYDPASDTWVSLPSPNAPSARTAHSAVWASSISRMIVFGGQTFTGSRFSNGASFTPGSPFWEPIASIPLSSRSFHSAVWTGSEMIVWGGIDEFNTRLSNGASYDPISNSWVVLNPSPLSARHGHFAAWTGSEMIVFSKSNEPPYNCDGALYNPVTKAWTLIPGRPCGLRWSASWTGSGLFLWGDSSGYYNLFTNSWTEISQVNAPVRVRGSVLTSIGSFVVSWGDCDGAGPSDFFDLQLNIWGTIPATGAPGTRCDHATVWTGTQMLVWGGGTSHAPFLNSGGILTPHFQ